MTRASMTLLWFSMTIFVSLALYHTSYRVEELGRNLRHLNHEIEAEQSSIHVLRAEYVYLTDPSRIEKVSKKHLSLQPTAPRQVASLGRLRKLVPTRREMARNTVRAMPIASLRPTHAGHRPRALAEEKGRLNTHMIIRKASVKRSLPSASYSSHSSYALATSGNRP